MSKPFRELTKDEAIELARNCMRGATSENEIRCRLSQVGFDGAAAAVVSTRQTGHGMNLFMAMVMVRGPQGEIINV